MTARDMGAVDEETHHIKSGAVRPIFMPVVGEPFIGGTVNPLLFAKGDGLRWLPKACGASRFDFNENDGVTFSAYEVDLSVPCVVIAVNDCEA